MTKDLQIHRPAPITIQKNATVFDNEADSKKAINVLESGNHIVISGFYSNGLLLLKALKKYLDKKLPNTSFQEQRASRAKYHILSNRILVEIENHTVALKKAPSIGWLKKLYPETSDFILSFPQVQGLNSSWQWYTNGISIPVLRNKIHPYYGTYFPTRFDHVILFDNWLKRYEGPKKTAIDVGIGSGILSFQLLKYGFQKVYGTDINPNAIVGLAAFMGDTKLSRKIALEHAPLFGKYDTPTELIVFNPPWLPKTNQEADVDAAIYYDEHLFPDFFAEAKNRLAADGQLVILFSNLSQITNFKTSHPIEKELSEGGRFRLERCFKKRVKEASTRTKRDQNWRGSEEVELWVLMHKVSL
ncbi:50S ribosomal protein L11 methyltransferase [uncultured Dokdonia sp.]|uniref:methyltransferase n=1 Tax=uncultured Dokdonia sp. TaxID=575653 RepID=UPI00260A283B|nr:50S ribosomal protein L11 methyltransferase [uncultured Dokdonia sp.]